MGVLSKSSMVDENYSEERKKIFSYYHPIELNEKLAYEEKNRLMIEWWTKHINLFIKYKFEEKIIKEVSKDLSVMSLRDGAKEFLKNMKDRNIPVVILSAGIGNFIEQFLINNNCNYDNIYIISNFIKFENRVAVGIYEDIIHSLNKNDISLLKKVSNVIKDRKNIILFGDTISDIKMAREEDRENALKIGFLEQNVEENKIYYEASFDVVCTDNTSYNYLSDKIKILKK